jgi:hypothetical protein
VIQTLQLLFEGLSHIPHAMFDAEETSNMSKQHYLFQVVCIVALTSAATGCRHNSATADAGSAEGQFVQAFRSAHDNKELLRSLKADYYV